MSDYIIFWKDAPGQQVSTTVDAHNQCVFRDDDYVTINDIKVLKQDYQVFLALDAATGEKFAVTPEMAQRTLGWDV